MSEPNKLPQYFNRLHEISHPVRRKESMSDPRFSLIVPTLGRTTELITLLTSVHRQDRDDVELIIVDQNDDDRVLRIVEAFSERLTIRHERSTLKNPSDARNLGMSLANGEIVAFPDDDCWYPDELLNQVDTWFQIHQQYAVLAVGALDDEGVPSGNRWPQKSCDITPINSLRTTFCSSLFFISFQLKSDIRFDPHMFPGEETDFVLRQMATGLRGRLDSSMHICHPRRDMLSGTVTAARATRYGAAMGDLVRRHSLPHLWIGLLSYDLARAIAIFLRGRIADSICCFAHLRGLFCGFIASRPLYD